KDDSDQDVEVKDPPSKPLDANTMMLKLLVSPTYLDLQIDTDKYSLFDMLQGKSYTDQAALQKDVSILLHLSYLLIPRLDPKTYFDLKGFRTETLRDWILYMERTGTPLLPWEYQCYERMFQVLKEIGL